MTMMMMYDRNVGDLSDLMINNRFFFCYSERTGEERRYEMGERRAGSCRRGVGRTDLQIRCAVNGRMETAKELVEKVLNLPPRAKVRFNNMLYACAIRIAETRSK